MNVHVSVGAIHGLAEIIEGEGFVTIDPRQNQKEILITCAHEALHIAFPPMKEDDIEEAAQLIADVQWKLGFRIPKKNKKKQKKK
jgi:hypothetical protein